MSATPKPPANIICLEQNTALFAKHGYENFPDEANKTTWNRPQITESVTDGFLVSTYNFTNVCAELGGAYPVNQTESLTTAVLNISTFTSSSATTSLRLYVSSCDGTGEVNITKPAIYVFNGSAAVLMQRVPSTPGINQSSSNCTGTAQVVMTTSSYSDFCRVYSDRPECDSKTKTTVPAPSSSATKMSTIIAFAGVLLMAVAAL